MISFFEETLEQRPEESTEFQKIKCSVQAKTLEEFSNNFIYKIVNFDDLDTNMYYCGTTNYQKRGATGLKVFNIHYPAWKQ